MTFGTSEMSLTGWWAVVTSDGVAGGCDARVLCSIAMPKSAEKVRLGRDQAGKTMRTGTETMRKNRRTKMQMRFCRRRTGRDGTGKGRDVRHSGEEGENRII